MLLYFLVLMWDFDRYLIDVLNVFGVELNTYQIHYQYG